MASGYRRPPTRPRVLLGGFHKPGPGQAWATRLPCSPRQEELVADVSRCANLGLRLPEPSTRPPAKEEALGLAGPRGPAARAWATWVY